VPSLVSRLVFVALVSLVCAAPAYAAWEAPLRIDQTSEGFGNSGAGDVAVGDDGLATILFLQNDDDGTKLWATRRGAAAAAWLAPLGPVSAPADNAFTIEAAPDGSTAGAYREDKEDPGSDLPEVDDTVVPHATGLGWGADQSSAAPKTADLGVEGAPELPAIDADGKGFGWIAFVDDEKNVQIRRFSLTNPAATTDFTIPPTRVDPGPDNQNLNETLGRSNARIDVNAAGDVIVSFVEERRTAECCEPEPPSERTGIRAVRKLASSAPTAPFTGPFPISHSSETDPVTDHDPTIADNGDATILFAADPDRTADRLYARRWLASGPTAGAPRPEGSIELVSSSDETAADVSRVRAEAGPEGRVTALWSQGNVQLNSAERFGTWTLPETLSNNTAAFDAAVDAAGVATAVYRDNTVVHARRRAPGEKWGPAEPISTAAVPTDFTPKVDAGNADQADAYIVQADGSRRAAYARRFTGTTPVQEPAEFRPDTLDCPGDITVLAGDAGANSIAGVDGRETILGGDGDDTLSGGGGDDCIRGEAGNDTAVGGAGNDDVDGGDGDDRVAGDDGNDDVNGGAGTDRVNGGAGDDSGLGGDGNDTLDGADGTDSLNGELGDDQVRGGAGDDILGGAEGNDTVFGNAGANQLFGGVGNDRLLGGPQNDRLFGEDGDDITSGGPGPDMVSGGAGDDKIRGGKGKNTLFGGADDDGIRGGSQADRALGSAGLDTLFGLGGNDTLLGGADADKVYGGDGRDRLSGNAGRDRVRGGKGADRLIGGAGGDNLNGEGGRDRVFGGGGNDRIGAADGKRDRINCGKGRKDRVVADKRDRVSSNCEKVTRKR
jgi:Ca2+-binding RTX toxin-like protein